MRNVSQYCIVAYKCLFLVFHRRVGSESGLYGLHTTNGCAGKTITKSVAALVSVPISSSFDFGVGDANKRFRYTAKLQPVIPFTLGDGWNIISRTILPIVNQNDVFASLDEESGIGGESGVYAGHGSQTGLGDTTQSLFLSPNKQIAGKFILGFGPALLFPLLPAAT